MKEDDLSVKKMVTALLLVAMLMPMLVFSYGAEAGAAGWDLTISSLKDTYKDLFDIGNIMEPGQTSDSSITAMYNYHYNIVTAENAMKPQYLSPSKGSYNFSSADTLVDWAQKNGLAVHGHTLVWHSQSAAWLTGSGKLTRAEAKANMEDYIKNVAGHFKGKVVSWDVVNEAMVNSGGSSKWKGSLRMDSPWYMAYANGADASKGESGADYIYDAFVFARQYDSDAVLYYNDYNETEAGKRDAIAAMVEELNEQWKTDARNTEPGRMLIEGIGMQSHFWTSNLQVSDVEATIKRFIETGAKLIVSELDIPFGNWNKPHNGSLTAAEEKTQAELYRKVFDVYVKYAANIERVTFWGKTDPQSWRKAGCPLLFDASFQAKESFHEVIKAASAATAPTPSPAPTPAPPAEAPSTWAADAVGRSIDLGLVPGDFQVKYTQAATRAEFCALAVKLYEKHSGKEITERKTFNDTTDINVQKMGGLGVVSGVGDGTSFDPDGVLNREMAATLLANLAKAIGQPFEAAEAAFEDNASISSWAANAVGQAQGAGIMSGVGGNRFDPQGEYSREQSIVAMLKLFDWLG